MKVNRSAIEVLMARKKLTMQELGKLSGVHRISISRILNVMQCTPRTLGRIADGLGVNVEDISGA